MGWGQDRGVGWDTVGTVRGGIKVVWYGTQMGGGDVEDGMGLGMGCDGEDGIRVGWDGNNMGWKWNGTGTAWDVMGRGWDQNWTGGARVGWEWGGMRWEEDMTRRGWDQNGMG